MARPAVGTVIRRRTKQGTSFALRVSYGGTKPVIQLGGSWEGWTEERVQAEREYVAAQMARGEWLPPATQRQSVEAPVAASVSFQVFASGWLARRKPRVEAKTYADYHWRLRAGMDHFGAYRLDEIDAGVIDDFVDGALRERDAIERAAADGTPLTETVSDKHGRSYVRRRRGLDRSSINKVIAGVRIVLKDAQRRGLISVNPAADPACLVSTPRPSRSFLEAEQIEELLQAAADIEKGHRGLDWQKVGYIRDSSASNLKLARELGVSDVLVSKVRRRLLWNEEAAPRNRNDIPRRAILATLVLAGVRISELCGLVGEDVDLASGRIRVRRDVTKTDAGERFIPIVPALREALVDHRATHHYCGGDFVFGTRTGGRNSPDNIRARIVAGAHQRANERLADASRPGIGHLTPHTLRRTFASLLAESGVSPRRAMYLLGHTDPKLTMSVYQQVLDLSAEGERTLASVLGGDLVEVGLMLSGRSQNGALAVVNRHAIDTQASSAALTRSQESR